MGYRLEREIRYCKFQIIKTFVSMVCNYGSGVISKRKIDYSC
jgi:hypothetical protein